MAVTPRVFVLGAGHAGRALARALADNGVEVAGLHGRRAASSGQAISTGPLPASLASADVVLVTVRDSQLDAAIAELLAANLKPGATVLHASGSAEPSGVEELRRRGYGAGTFHPLVPLNTDSRGAAQLQQGAWIGIDGDDKARAVATGLAAILGAQVMSIPGGKKSSYHAAAVLASNFPSVLAYLAKRLLADAGVESSEAAAAVIALMHASVDNLRGHDPEAALTGPVVRGDAGTVRAHLDVLSKGKDGDEKILAAYVALTRVAIEMARQQGTDSNALRQIEEALSRV